MTNLIQTKENILNILKDGTKDLWKKEEDSAFLKEVAEDIAKVQIKIIAASDDERKQIYEKDLKHLMAQLNGRIGEKKDLLIKQGDFVLTKVLDVAIKLSLKTLMSFI